MINIFDRQSGGTKVIELVNQSPEPVGWIGAGADLRLVFLRSHRWEKDPNQQWYLGEPESGKYVVSEKPPLPGNEWARRLSPDGGQVAGIQGKDRLTITSVKTGQKRSFTFHEDDRRFVHEEGFQWLSPRYMLLHLNRLAFLDVQTLKMSYPLASKDESRRHTFSPDFQWVLWTKPEDGLYLSSIILPEKARP